jgi:membrane protease YdiL (CAAX protease family)
MNAAALPALSLALTSRTATWLGLASVLGTFVAVRTAAAAAGLPKPGQFAIVGAALLAAWLLARAGVSWSEVGFARPASWPRTALAAVALYGAATAAIVLVVYPLARTLGLPPMRVDSFDGLRGNLPLLLAVLAMVWTTVAFGEEFVFRGFVQKGLAGALGGGTLPPLAVAALAIVLQALAFGVLHAYLGSTGVLNATVVALVFGIGLHFTGGSLWALVIAHGMIDTVAMVALYAGVVPR